MEFLGKKNPFIRGTPHPVPLDSIFVHVRSRNLFSGEIRIFFKLKYGIYSRIRIRPFWGSCSSTSYIFFFFFVRHPQVTFKSIVTRLNLWLLFMVILSYLMNNRNTLWFEWRQDQIEERVMRCEIRQGCLNLLNVWICTHFWQSYTDLRWQSSSSTFYQPTFLNFNSLNYT